MTIQANQTLQREEHIETAELDGEWVLLNIGTHAITKLNGVGGYIWSAIPECSTVAGLAEKISSEYDIPMETAFADVQAFAGQLMEAGLLKYE